MRLLYGTGNPAKLSAMQKRLSGFRTILRSYKTAYLLAYEVVGCREMMFNSYGN